MAKGLIDLIFDSFMDEEYLNSLDESILIWKDDTNELVDNLRVWTKHALIPGNTIWVHKLKL